MACRDIKYFHTPIYSYYISVAASSLGALNCETLTLEAWPRATTAADTWLSTLLFGINHMRHITDGGTGT